MIVCVCAAVSERQLEAVIQEGATTLKDVARRCSAGTGCGTCRASIRDCLRRARAATAIEQVAETIVGVEVAVTA